MSIVLRDKQAVVPWLGCECLFCDPGLGLIKRLEFKLGRVGYSSEGDDSSGGQEYQTLDPFTNASSTHYITGYGPQCNNCSWLNDLWKASILQGDVATMVKTANVMPITFSNSSSTHDVENSTMYLNRTSFCSNWTWDDCRRIVGQCAHRIGKTLA
jgi:hypothetical protein